MWNNFNPGEERKWALLFIEGRYFSDQQYYIAQWEPKTQSWHSKELNFSIFENKDIFWCELPKPPFNIPYCNKTHFIKRYK